LKKIICLCGISGIGKTHKRTHDKNLKDLPFVDVADIRAENIWFSHTLVFDILLQRLALILKNADIAVVEAAFLRDSIQRIRMKAFAYDHQAEVIFVELKLPRKNVLLQRIEKDRIQRLNMFPEKRESIERYSDARRRFVESAYEDERRNKCIK
jgi:predicted kinase